jgi:hypothetical protein
MSTVDISICADCLVLLSNGELTDSDGLDIAAAQAAKIMAVWEDSEIVPNLGEDEDGSFSWQACEGCRSSLGGDRYPAVVIY